MLHTATVLVTMVVMMMTIMTDMLHPVVSGRKCQGGLDLCFLLYREVFEFLVFLIILNIISKHIILSNDYRLARESSPHDVDD